MATAIFTAVSYRQTQRVDVAIMLQAFIRGCPGSYLSNHAEAFPQFSLFHRDKSRRTSLITSQKLVLTSLHLAFRPANLRRVTQLLSVSRSYRREVTSCDVFM